MTEGDDIARWDEVLELLFWLEGEAVPDSATPEGMARFLCQSPAEIRRTLQALERRGDVAVDAGSGQYRLTDIGRREGGRRFNEQFAALMGAGHGECSDPECDCRDGAAGCRPDQPWGGHGR